MKNWQKIITAIATFALLFNSFAAPLTVLAQTQPNDLCSDVEGVQETVPDGLIQNTDGTCTTPTPPPPPASPIDICPNIDGDQGTLPEGYELNTDNQCVLIPSSPKDLCPNIDGDQTEIPKGMVVDVENNCITPPPVDVCPNIDGVQEIISDDLIKNDDGTCTPKISPPSLPEVPAIPVVVSVWKDNPDGSVTTANPVGVGIEYRYKDTDVKIIFTKITTPGYLTIKEINLSDEQKGTSGAVTNTAYDISSDMTNGTFTYDLTLPNPDPGQDVEVKYSEDGNNYQTVGSEKQNDAISVKNLNHFSIWIVSTTLGITGLINGQTQVTVSPNETVEATITAETSGSGDSNDWEYSSYRFETGPWINVNTADHTTTGQYHETFSLTAPAGAGTYDISFRVCNYPDCSGGTGSRSLTYTLTDGIIVVGGYIPTKICHATGNPNEWVSNTPATLGQLMGHVRHQGGADIIPPIPVFLPTGQNWSTGETIWNNDCSIPTGSISGYKWNDLNENGSRETGGWQWVCNPWCHLEWTSAEPKLVGWTINLKNAAGAIVATTTTGADGSYSFNNLISGDYEVCEVLQGGWTNITPLCQTVDLSSDEDEYKNFGNHEQPTGSITVHKQVDNDGNGTYESGDAVANDLGFRWGLDGVTPSRSMGTVATNLVFGNHSIAENTVAGYVYTGWYSTNNGSFSCSNPQSQSQPPVSTPLGTGYENVEITLCNKRVGSISGYKWSDQDGDRNWDDGEDGLEGWTIYLDLNNNLQLDPNEPSTTTGADGSYTFSDLDFDSYYIREVNQTGWNQTTPYHNYGSDYLTLNSGYSNATNRNFGNQQRGSIRVCKVIIDAQGQITNGSDMPATTFTVNWTGGAGLAPTVFNSGYTPNTTIFSSSEGNDSYCVDYPNIPLANYGYSQEIISSSGWEIPKYNDQFNSTVLDLGDFNYYHTPGDENSNGYMDLTNQAGPNRTLVILNQYRVGSVTVTKFNDLDQDGEWDQGDGGEPVLSGWDIRLDQTTQTTVDGQTTFSNIVQGTYGLTEMWKDGQEDWIQTNISCDNEERGGIDNSNQHEVYVSAGQTTNCYIGNFEQKPSLEISKTNDKPSGIGAGSSVIYTVTLTNTGNIPVLNTSITDILPGGFSYVAGSTTGNTTADPSVSGSVLTWNIGTLNPEQSFTIHYEVKTSSDLVDGIYTNFADCSAMTRSEKEIFCDPASSSTVSIGRGVSFSGGLGGQVLGIATVLGASTELPGTGSPTVLLIIALGLVGVGLLIRGYNIKLMKKAKKSKVRKTGKKAKKVAKKGKRHVRK